MDQLQASHMQNSVEANDASKAKGVSSDGQHIIKASEKLASVTQASEKQASVTQASETQAVGPGRRFHGNIRPILPPNSYNFLFGRMLNVYKPSQHNT